MKKMVFIGILFLRVLCFSQIFTPKHTFNLELGLPNGFSNKPFKNIMQGLVVISPYYQYAFKKHFILGAGLHYHYFNINEFKITTPINGGIHAGGFFIKFGREKFLNNYFATDFSLKMGMTQNIFRTEQNDSLGVQIQSNNSLYIEPCIGLTLMADEISSFRFYLGYAFQNFDFKPSLLNLNSFGAYKENEIDRLTSFLIVGFGYTYYFNQGKKTAED